jgi:protoporphyrinogen oxidase
MDVCVLEADPRYVGGISRTVEWEGFRFDIGGHRFFSKSAEVNALWKEILGKDLLVRARKSRIYYRQKFYPYPFSLFKTLHNLGIVESLRCGFSYLYSRVFAYRPARNFEQWVSNQFGARLFRIFFKTYTEKVWGISCSEISADWAAQRIHGLSIPAILSSAFKGVLGIRKSGAIKTLIEEFYYPRLGPGMMWEAAAARIKDQGGEVLVGAKVQSLRYDHTQKRWQVRYGNGQEMFANHVISSMPMQQLIQALDNVPQAVQEAADKLRYRDFLMVALVLKDTHRFDDNWLYVHSPEVKVGRIQNFKAWSPEMVPDAEYVCYGMEYFCFEGDTFWQQNDEALIALATKEIAQIGLVSEQDIIKGHVVRQPKAYPIYDQHYNEHVAVIRDWITAQCPQLQIAGRNGMHKYNNQDHSMMTALMAAKNILAGAIRYDVWRINQDAEYHEKGQSGSTGERHVPVTPVAQVRTSFQG